METTKLERLIINSVARESSQYFMFNCLPYNKMSEGNKIVHSTIEELENRFGKKFDTKKNNHYSNDIENYNNMKVDSFLGIKVIGSNKNNGNKKEKKL